MSRFPFRLVQSFVVGIFGAAVVSIFLFVQLHPVSTVPQAREAFERFLNSSGGQPLAFFNANADLGSALSAEVPTTDTAPTMSEPVKEVAPLVRPTGDEAGPLDSDVIKAQPNPGPPQESIPDAALPRRDDETALAALSEAPAYPPTAGVAQPSEDVDRRAPATKVPDIDQLHWRRFALGRARRSVTLPTRLFRRSLRNPSARDRLWTTGNGRALFRLRQVSQLKPHDIGEMRRHLLTARYAQADLTKNELSDRSLILSGTFGTERFQQHVVLSCNGRESLSWTLIYPQDEQALFEKIGHRIAKQIVFQDADKTAC